MFSATLPPKIRELAKTDSAQSRRGQHRRFETQRGDRPVGLHLLRERRSWASIRELFAKPTRFEDDHLLVVETEGQGAGPYAQAHETQRGGHALRSGAGAARGGDARLSRTTRSNMLVATDIVARGIDIEDIGTGAQLRRAARPRGLHPPHRPYGPRERPRAAP